MVQTQSQVPVKMYTKIPCPYCVSAKRLFAEKNIQYEEIDLTDKPDEFDRLRKATSYRTVPMIFIGDLLIGGYSDLRALEEEGKLDTMLNPPVLG